MAINAAVAGDKITSARYNDLLMTQPFKLAREGSLIDSKTGAGVAEFSVADNYHAIRITATGVTTITRVELEIAADGEGQDLTISLLDTDFNPNGSAEGTVLGTITVPKEFLPASAAYWSIPLFITGLTEDANYWLKISKVGDLTDHFHLVGETTQDANHPCYYRAGTSGAWTLANSIHFKAYSGTGGAVYHESVGADGHIDYIFESGIMTKQYTFIPPQSGLDGGVRERIVFTFEGNVMTGGEDE